MAKRHQNGVDFQSRIRRAQEIIMAQSGIDEFQEITRLIVVKFLAEKSRKKGMPDFEEANMLLKGAEGQLAEIFEGGVNLQTPAFLYEELRSLLSGISVLAQDFHVLDGLFEILTARSYKSDKGQYFTPRHVIDMCVETLAPAPHETVCDPACGSGAFLKSTHSFQMSRFGKVGELYGFDYSRRACQVARLVSLLATDNHIVVRQADSLALPKGTLWNSESGTIEDCLPKDFSGFDVILTNPPFAGDVSNEAYARGYDLAQLARRKVERDILFMERCIGLLKPGGRMAMVVPDNKVSGRGFSGVRQWLLRRALIHSVVSLHRYTFLPYTSQKASVVIASKVHEGQSSKDAQIHLFRSDSPGKTSNGSPIFRPGKGIDDPPYYALDHDLQSVPAEMGENFWKA